jgi:hypothetical protein
MSVPNKSLFKIYHDEVDKNSLKKKLIRDEKEKPETSLKTKIHGIIFTKTNPNEIQKKNSCNCKNSQCLKLYCQCFSKFDFCDPEFCSCKGCANTKENEVNLKIKNIHFVYKILNFSYYILNYF